MLGLVVIFSLIIITLSAYGFITPRGYVSFARRFEAGPGAFGAGFFVRQLAYAGFGRAKIRG